MRRALERARAEVKAEARKEIKIRVELTAGEAYYKFKIEIKSRLKIYLILLSNLWRRLSPMSFGLQRKCH